MATQGINKQGVYQLLEGIREARGLTLDDMAELTDLPKSTLYYYITDLSSLPKPAAAAKLCKGYGISFAQLAEAAGYDVQVDEVSEAMKLDIVRQLTLADYIKLHEGIENPTRFIGGIENILEMAKELQKTSGRL